MCGTDRETQRPAAVDTAKVASAEVAAPLASAEGDAGADGISGATLQTVGAVSTASGELDAPSFLEAQRRTIRSERDKPVWVVADHDPVRAAYRLMEHLSPAVSEDTPVLIKPNLGGFTWFRGGPDNGLVGRTTDPGFVEGLVRYLTDRGVRRITIAESWGVDDPSLVRRLFEVSGYRRLAERHPEVTLLDMNNFLVAGTYKFFLGFYKEAAEAGQPDMLMYLDTAGQADSTLDGVLAADGDGFDRASSVPAGLAIGSYNTVYADVVAARAAGLWDNPALERLSGSPSPPHLLRALRRFYGDERAADRIEVLGDGVIRHLPLAFDLLAVGPYEVTGNAREVLAGPGELEATYLGAGPLGVDEALERLPADGAWIMGDWAGRRLPPGVATMVRCGYTDSQLVIAFLSRYRRLDASTRPATGGDTASLFEGDVVEAFLDPDPAIPDTYFELEMSPSGQRLDLSVDLGNRTYVEAWESGMICETRIEEGWNVWTAVMTMPFGALPRPRPGDRWRANFYRTEGTGAARLYMAWRPTGTPRPKFHAPESFGTIVFGRKDVPI